jgi:hypothetical protein
VRIDYLTDDPAKEYAEAVFNCDSLAELKKALRPRGKWNNVALDAIAVVQAMKKDEWEEFHEGIKSERRGVFAGEEWVERYGAVLMPELMLKASVLARQFKVPWGCAFIQLREHERETSVVKAVQDE